MKVTIVPHPKHPDTHRLVKVETRGRVYALSWGAPFPDEEQVKRVWEESRHAFAPYDESTGRFLS